MAHRKLAPTHPGEVLALDFLEPLGVSQYRLAKDISVPARRINEIVHGTRAISADTALRLACRCLTDAATDQRIHDPSDAEGWAAVTMVVT